MKELPNRYVTSPNNITIRPATSESFNGIDSGMNGNANAKLPIGTITVDAMNNTLADPNLC